MAIAAGLLAMTVLPGQEPLPARIAAALARARPALLHHLGRSDGGVLALCCLAAAHDGVPVDDAVFGPALVRLARARLDDTYSLSLRLMVMAEIETFPDREALAEADTEVLLQRQTTGGFSYHAHDGWWDLSNTQYAALGLRAAAALGVDVPVQRWRLLYTAVQLAQLDNGAFTYREGQGKPSAYESMTVAGIAVLAVAAQFLDFDADAQRFHQQRIQSAWLWLAQHRQALGNRAVHSCYYFHYGLERAAILTDQERIGGADWYALGAQMLCDEQKKGGGWWGRDEYRPPAVESSRGHAVDTAFAVLFLRRRFQKVLGPVTGVRLPRTAALAATAGDAEIAAAAVADAMNGEVLLPGLLRVLHSDVVARRKAAVLALFAISGEDFGLQPYRSREADAAAIRRAELWWLRRAAK